MVGNPKYVWLCGLLLCGVPLFAQATPDSSVAAALSNLSARAGVVFAGEVIAVRPLGGVVEVEFRVDQNLKGASAGSYELVEWAGLWAAGQRRYWVGERAVVFLHDAGKGGLSSSVDGMDGILPITPDASNSLSIDVERLRTRVVRTVGAPMAAAGARMSLAQVASAVNAAPVADPTPEPLPRPVRKVPVIVQPLRPLTEMQREPRDQPGPGPPLMIFANTAVSRAHVASGRVLFLLAAVLSFSLSAHAGGPRWYTGYPFYSNVAPGQPVVFFTDNPLYYTDSGNLNANVTHAQADAMVAAAAATWNVPTSRLTLAQGGTLAEHVSSANTYFNGTSVVFPDDVMLANYHAKPIAIIYDTDGSVIDTLLGSGASSPSGCLQNGVVESVDGLDPAGTIDHAVLILNGRCVGTNANQLKQMQYQLMRKFGRIIGMGWSQLNDNIFTGATTPTAIELANWPVMHPIDVICGTYTYQCMTQPFTLRIDDLSVLAQLYPVTTANITPGKTLSGQGALDIYGTVQFPTGQGMDAVNVVLRRQVSFTNPDAYETTSAVSGGDHQQFMGNPVTGAPAGVAQSSGNSASDHEGWYRMQRVPIQGSSGWESLYLTTEPINPLYSGDYAIAPYVGSSKAMSGTTVTLYDGLESAGRDVRMNFVIADAPNSCNTGNDGQEYAPVAPDPSGWWTGLLCQDVHTAWTKVSVQPGRTWTLETTALDENGIGSAAKAHILLGVWKAGDPGGTSPTVTATPSSLNAMVVGMTQLHMDATGTPQTYRIAIADERGDGRPDFTYKARLLYADAISPAQVGPRGGRITITGQGFRNGNVVTVNGVAATVTSWNATQIVATTPTMSAANMTATGVADVAVVDASTGGATVIQAALSYGGVGTDSIALVSAPVQVQTGTPSSTAFAVRVFGTDGVTPAPGATVQFAATGAATTFAACGAATCTLTTDANGLAQTYITATAAGSITLTATEQSGGASVQAIVNAAAPPDTIALISAPAQVQTGTSSTTAFSVRVFLSDGVTPVAGATVRFVATGAASNFAACGTASCTLITNSSGLVQSNITATAPGTITLTATEQSGGASVQATVNAVSPPDTITLVSAPTQVQTGTASSTAFAVRVLAANGVTPAAGATVRFAATGAATTFASCGAATCTLITDASGYAQTSLTATAAGTITLTATEQSGGASVQATVDAVAPPVRLLTAISAARYLAAGAAANWTVAVLVTQNGQPVSGQAVAWTATAGINLGSGSSATGANGTAFVAVSTTGLSGGTQATTQGCAWTTVCASSAVFGVDPSQWMATITSGAGQSMQALQTLAPVVLLVTDLAGHPVQSATVSVRQTVDAWQGVCPPRGRCAAAPVLASSQKTQTTDASGFVLVTPLELPGIASVVNIAVVTGTQGFVSLSLTKTP